MNGLVHEGLLSKQERNTEVPNYEVKFRYTDSVLIPGATDTDAQYAFEKDFGDQEMYPDLEILGIEEVVD